MSFSVSHFSLLNSFESISQSVSYKFVAINIMSYKRINTWFTYVSYNKTFTRIPNQNTFLLCHSGNFPRWRAGSFIFFYQNDWCKMIGSKRWQTNTCWSTSSWLHDVQNLFCAPISWINDTIIHWCVDVLITMRTYGSYTVLQQLTMLRCPLNSWNDSCSN